MAVDGILAADTSGRYTEYGCTATNGVNDTKQWWKVDLKRAYAIKEIKIFIKKENSKFVFVYSANITSNILLGVINTIYKHCHACVIL